MKLQINKEFKELIPPLSADEYKQLEENILTDGCREPLVIWNSTIVDGHNRYNICTENDIPFDTVEKNFKDREEVMHWIILNQFGRRNLTVVQRSELALRLKPILRKKAKENQKISPGRSKKGFQNSDNLFKPEQFLQNSVKTVEKSLNQNSDTPIIEKVNTHKEVAKIAGVSHDTIWKTEKILDNGTPEQIDRARKGGKGNSVSAIFKEVTENKDETKICNTCGKELPLSEFYQGKRNCKQCHNQKTHKVKDAKGNIMKISPELREIKEEDVIGNLYNVDEVVVHTIEDAIEEFEVNFNTYLDTLDGILEYYVDLLKDAENNKKIMTVLSEAVTAMSNMKGKYSYEKL